MTERPDEQEIDLRDEIQYLRELVDRLMTELKDERARARPLVMQPPQPIIIREPPVPIHQPPWWTPWRPLYEGTTWCSADTNTNSLTWAGSTTPD